MSAEKSGLGRVEKMAATVLLVTAGALAVRAAEWLGVPDMVRDVVDDIIASPTPH